MKRQATIARRLTAWFAANARDLPWRTNRSGYSALISEAMLQQTQVSRVIDKYRAFMQRFPTIQTLADADEQQVLAAWQGLGYYRRARNLHAAAKMIVRDFAGTVPADVHCLLKLPGVGRYTAGAIASIAFDRHEPIVDGNVHRVLSRLQGKRDYTHAEAWTHATQFVHAAESPGMFNEAMMELGATVCTPSAPACHACPLHRFCTAARTGRAHDIPAPRRSTQQIAVHHHAVIIHRGKKILLEKRPSNGLWSNMWQVPTIETDVALNEREIAARLPQRIALLQPLSQFQHITTHRRITFYVFTAHTRARRGVWREPTDVRDLPLSNAQQRIVAMATNITGAVTTPAR